MTFQFSVMGTGVGTGTGFFCWAGLMAGLQVGQALRCSSSSNLHVPGYTTSICDEDVMHHSISAPFFRIDGKFLGAGVLR